MKKLELVGLLTVLVLALVSAVCLSKRVGRGENTDTSTAISLLQKEGYSDIKIIDRHYLTAIPPNYDGTAPLVGALDSLVVNAQKDGVDVKLRVKSIGLPKMSIEKM
jgi:hypothetical protein